MFRELNHGERKENRLWLDRLAEMDADMVILNS